MIQDMPWRKSKRDSKAKKEAELCRAEAQLETLRRRSEKASRELRERRNRNHWRESIEQMIQGTD